VQSLARTTLSKVDKDKKEIQTIVMSVNAEICQIMLADLLSYPHAEGIKICPVTAELDPDQIKGIHVLVGTPSDFRRIAVSDLTSLKNVIIIDGTSITHTHAQGRTEA